MGRTGLRKGRATAVQRPWDKGGPDLFGKQKDKVSSSGKNTAGKHTHLLGVVVKTK